MMKYALVILVCWFVVSQGVLARLGENITQCEQRYGTAVTNYPGLGDVTAVNQYVKDGITITIWFARTPYKDARAAMVLYSRYPPGEVTLYFTPKAIGEDERVALLNTTGGRWELYNVPDKLAGRPAIIKSISSSPSITEKRRDQVKQTVESALNALFPNAILAKLQYYIKDIGHNGTQLFAFEALRGIAIVSFDESAAIAKWASDRIAKREASKTPPKSEITGF